VNKPRYTREELLMSALQVFRQQGYHGTSMDDLALACGLKKGSFYYHYPSKEDLLVAVLQFANEHFERVVFPLASAVVLSPRTRVWQMFKQQQLFYGEMQSGCLMGNLALEVGGSPKLPFLPEIRRFFDGWQGALRELLKGAFSTEEAEKLSKHLMLEYEGALLMSRVYNNFDFLAETQAKLLDKFPAFPPPSILSH
jgi:TetR/AcrR family transcriptional regulator, transcriptional repressor for nem operon